MAITLNLGTTAAEGTTSLSGTQAISSDYIVKESYTASGSNAIPASSADYQVPLAFIYNKLQSCYLLSTAAMTLEFNNSTTGVPTITLAANTPYIWTLASGATNPFTATITTLYVTSAAGGDLQMWFQVNR